MEECSLLLTSTSLVPRPVQKIGEKGLVFTVCACAQNIPGIPDNTMSPPCAVTSGTCIHCIFNRTLVTMAIDVQGIDCAYLQLRDEAVALSTIRKHP